MTCYQFTISTIKKAGEMLLVDYLGNHASWIKAGDIRNIVTDVDFKINNFLVEEIKRNYPEHSIYSEENENSVENSKFLWVLDPIDGTANFARRIPHFAISLGLSQDNQPLVGAVFNPITKELFSFERGKGAFFDSKLIKTSNTNNLSLATILMVSGRRPELRDWGARLYRNLLERANKTRNLASSALDICFLADGRVEGVIYGELTTLDIAPAIGILLEAGGKITDFSGKPVEFSRSPQKILASNGMAIHGELLKLIND